MLLSRRRAAWIRPTVDAAFHNERGASVCEFADAFFLQMQRGKSFPCCIFQTDFYAKLSEKAAIRGVLDLLGLSVIRDAFARRAILCD